MAAACALAAVTTLQAQNTVDLNAQRKESQVVTQIPGHKLDHRGIIVNPTPQQMSIQSGQSLDISRGFLLKDKQQCFSGVLAGLNQQKKGVPLTVDFGTKPAAKLGVKSLSGAYALTVDAKGVTVVGYDETGAFYGLQTLLQLLESPAVAEGQLPHLSINDYPSIARRGVVEGFYGNPWSHKVRLSLIDFYGKFKLNTYIFGPKDDPYHSSPHWRKPYPADEAEQIKELVDACRRNHVNFVWAVHPGKDIRWNDEDFHNLVGKFEAMYEMGVRSFAIFFDDISGEGTNPEKQAALLNRLVAEFINVKGDVSPLIFCPTDYTKSWANPTPQGSLPLFGKILDPSIAIFWTGDAVCSDVTKSTLDWVNSRILRPAFTWWNYPVTDYVRNLLLQGPVYGLDTSLKEGTDLSGFVSNPMEHGEASKLALYSVADYTWNIAAYNPMDSWERALVELAGNASNSYRTFAIHSGDTGTGYRRDESWTTDTLSLNNYTQAQYDALYQEFAAIERVANDMEQHCDNAPLMSELRPWLTEFSQLGTRGRKTLEIMKLFQGDDLAAFWEAFATNLMSKEEKAAFEAHSSGTMKLQPFYETTMDRMLVAFYKRLTGVTPVIPQPVGSYSTLRKPAAKLMFDDDDATFYTSSRSQKTDHWVGVDLNRVQPLTEVTILQGRNSVDDVDYFDRAIVEYSADGNEWTALTDTLEKQYVIRWEGSGIEARFVRLRKLESKKRNWLAIRTFAANPVRAEKLGFAVEAADVEKALAAFDKHPGTSYKISGSLAFDVPQGKECVTLLTRPSAIPMTIKTLAADGRVLSVTTTSAAFCPIPLTPATKRIVIEGGRELFEAAF